METETPRTTASLSRADRAILIVLVAAVLAAAVAVVFRSESTADIRRRQNELEDQVVRLDARERTGRDMVLTMLGEVRSALQRIDEKLTHE